MSTEDPNATRLRARGSSTPTRVRVDIEPLDALLQKRVVGASGASRACNWPSLIYRVSLRLPMPIPWH